MLSLFASTDATDILQNQIYYWTYTQNIFIAFNGFPKGYDQMLTPLWSLAIEGQFYLFWPLIIYFLTNKNIVKVSLLLILICIALRNIIHFAPFPYVFTFARLDGLLIGSVLGIIIRENKELLEKIVPKIFIAASAVLFLVVLNAKSLFPLTRLMERAGYITIDLLLGCLLIFLFDTKKIGRALKKIFESDLLVFFGKYSYGMYIFHYFIYVLLYLPFGEKFVSSFSHPAIFRLIAAAISILICIAISFVSYHLFEKRFLLLEKRVTPDNLSLKVVLPQIAEIEK